MKLHVIGPNLMTQTETFHVHKEGCADVVRSPLYRARDHEYDRTHPGEYSSIHDVVDVIYSDILAENDSNWQDYVSEFKFFNCCIKDLKYDV